MFDHLSKNESEFLLNKLCAVAYAGGLPMDPQKGSYLTLSYSFVMVRLCHIVGNFIIIIKSQYYVLKFAMIYGIYIIFL